MSEFDKVHERTFGFLQGEKVVDSRPRQTGGRFECQLCGERKMSDEALELHLVHHRLVAISVSLEKLAEGFVPKSGIPS